MDTIKINWWVSYLSSSINCEGELCKSWHKITSQCRVDDEDFGLRDETLWGRSWDDKLSKDPSKMIADTDEASSDLMLTSASVCKKRISILIYSEEEIIKEMKSYK